MQYEDKSIGELAYRLWQSRGCPAGTAEQDWLDAEKQLQAIQSSAVQTSPQAAKSRPTKAESVDDSLKGSFPASGPPASLRADEPPANADAKWKAAEAARKNPLRRSSRSGRNNPNSDATR